MKIVAKALIFDKQGRLLVLRRSDSHPHFAHHLDFPGGEVEQGEDPAAAVAREIAEETGLAITWSQLHQGFEKNPSTTLTHILLVANLDSTRPNVVVSWEHDDYKWLTAGDLLSEQLPRNADPYYMSVMAWLSLMPANRASFKTN